MKVIAKKLQKTDLITSAEYQGLTGINGSSLNYQVVITCEPINRLQARRNCLHVIAETLEDNRIAIPHDQLDVHTK